jgi:hypothetical protein
VEVKSKDEIINKLASQKESISYKELEAEYEALKIQHESELNKLKQTVARD